MSYQFIEIKFNVTFKTASLFLSKLGPVQYAMTTKALSIRKRAA